ncbi:MAG TPA: S8 family serine peptidase [Patescibacteria group bacterium]|jgi:subtilisin family serine protease|nr:S8 family serine peptidase [Patescibacteria group bacterium]
MKTNTKVHLARGFLVSAILASATLAYVAPSFVTTMPQDSADTLVPTRPITKNHSTGGTSTQSSSDTSETAASDSTSTSSTSAPSAQQLPKSTANESTTNAPKQSEIKRGITKERVYRAFLVPNDPYAQSSSVLTQTNVPSAWDISTGSTVVVADIDSGFALNHEDLSAAWYTNAGEQGMTSSSDSCWTGTPEDKSANNCDDDANGYVDDWRGWNFVAVDNNPQAGRGNPTGSGVSHGTETAGLIGAVSNNGIGTASFNWHTKLMPLQALDDNGSGYTSDVVAAIYYAVDNGASVINMSLGSYQSDPYLDQAVQYAYDHNVVVVAAAGNCGTGQEYGCDPANPGAIAFPALDPHVIAVGAVDGSNQRATFSSYGPALDVVAPGSGSIISTMWLESNQTSAYSSTLYGTSFATPIVSSLVSLLRSERPDSSVDDITALVDASAQKVSGLAGRDYNASYGHGLIDSAQSLSVARALQTNSATPVLSQTGSNVSEHSFASNSVLTSGCSVSTSVYCTVWAQDTHGYDRYLPYKLSTDGSWQWYGSVLGNGEWRLRTRSGDSVSAETYFLFAK